MSSNQRIGLIAVAIVFAVVAFVLASSGSGDESTDTSTTPTTTPATAPEAQVTRIQIRGGEVAGGPADIKVTKGDRVRIVVSADARDDIHLHGYDIEKSVEPGKPATFSFTADVEGIFELESHVAEDAGRDPLVGKLTVEPS